MALPPTTRAEPQTFGLYRARIVADGGEERRFRLLLYAVLPDRVHAEVLSPLGAPLLLVDGGEGRLAVTFVREGDAFVGPSSPDALGHVLGLPLGLGELVPVILTGKGTASGWRCERQPEGTPGLPQRLVLEAEGGARLLLELKGLRPLAADPETLGTGQAPAGVRLRPLDELAEASDRLDWLDEEGEP